MFYFEKGWPSIKPEPNRPSYDRSLTVSTLNFYGSVLILEYPLTYERY
jgi:hypothetical protein